LFEKSSFFATKRHKSVACCDWVPVAFIGASAIAAGATDDYLRIFAAKKKSGIRSPA